MNALYPWLDAPCLNIPGWRPPNFTGAPRRRGDAWEDPSKEGKKRLDEAYRSGEF
jgi:hypothetical protein